MSKNKKNKKTKGKGNDGSMVFSWDGSPEPVLSKSLAHYLGVFLDSDNRFYTPPIPWDGLARLRGANAYHGPLLEFKKNMILKNIVLPDIFTWEDADALVTDFVTFTNGYLQIIKTRMGGVVGLRHVPGLPMRRMKEKNKYCLVNHTTSNIEAEFRLGEVVHLKNYDVAQSIYGIPAYLGAIQSMLLNEDATLFRRRYYLNGAHMGYIFYSSGANLNDKDQEVIKDRVQSTKGLGNFKNMFLHIPNGREKDIQILPVGDFSTKDELEKIKNISRDDIIAAHRIPPALASIVPADNRGSTGDIEKASKVYMENEIIPLRRYILSINQYLPKNKHISFED